jgi:hypothetical protein
MRESANSKTRACPRKFRMAVGGALYYVFRTRKVPVLPAPSGQAVKPECQLDEGPL